jgi:molybdenum cofactor guanylyltransferase
MISAKTSHGLDAAVLVGGKARRMGGLPKGLLTVDGDSIVGRLVTLLQDYAKRIVLIGDPHGPYRRLKLPILPDVLPDRGAPGGVYTALRCATAEWIIIVSCDLPKLDAETIGLLVPDAASDVIMYRSAGRAQPLAALWRSSAVTAFELCFERGQPGFSEILSQLRVKWLDEDPGEALMNVNTPEEAERAGLQGANHSRGLRPG